MLHAVAQDVASQFQTDSVGTELTALYVSSKVSSDLIYLIDLELGMQRLSVAEQILRPTELV